MWKMVRKVGDKEAEKYGWKAAALWKADGGLKGLDDLDAWADVEFGMGIYEV